VADLAKLVVRLEAQSAQLLTELEKANRKIDRFAAQTSKTLNKWAGGLLAVFSARALIQFGADVLKAQDNLKDMAEQAGVSVETLSRLGYAAGQSGSDIESLQIGIAKLSKTAVASQKAGSAAADAFEAIGVSAEAADGSLKATDVLLLEIAESFSKHADGAEKSALAQALFGKSGAALIPFLNQGAAGIEELTRKADELGITVSTKAAAAADEFNDNLATLGAIARGVAGRALSELTPLVSSLAKSFGDMVAQGDGASRFASQLATGFKLIVDIGYSVYKTFDDIGTSLGALAAAAVAVAKGHFSEAATIIREANADQVESEKKANEFLTRLWDDTGQSIVDTVKLTDDIVKKSFVFGGNVAKSGVQEVKIGLQKIDVGAMEQVYADLDRLTSTSNEKALQGYYEQKAALDELASAQRITTEQYAARLEEVNKALADSTGVTELQTAALARQAKVQDEGKAIFEATRTPLEKYNAELVKLDNLLLQNAIDQETYNRAVAGAKDAYDEALGGANVFFKKASENGMKNGFDEGAKGVLQAFGDMLLQLAAQATAAQLGKLLFGGGGVGSGGGWVAAAASIFGGTRDSGGRGQPGVAYAIGTGAQPEMFVPDRPGTFTPANKLGGGVKMTNNFYVTAADGRLSMETQTQAANRFAAALAQSRRRNG
jgi:hypothetical protein